MRQHSGFVSLLAVSLSVVGGCRAAFGLRQSLGGGGFEAAFGLCQPSGCQSVGGGGVRQLSDFVSLPAVSPSVGGGV